MSQLTTLEAIKMIEDRARWCRSEGESDMRNITQFTHWLAAEVRAGKSSEEIFASLEEEEDE